MAVLSAHDYAAAVDAAVARGRLSRFPTAARNEILASAKRVDLPAKLWLSRPGDPGRMGIVVRGLVRVVHVTEDGHELTVLWGRAGADVSGLTLGERLQHVGIQAVTDVVWCDFDMAVVNRILQNDPQAAWIAIRVLEERIHAWVHELALFAYGDVRTRVKRLLLEIACKAPDQTLIAPVTQEELASGVGAARQSVARTLGELRRAGVVRTTKQGIHVLRPAALLAGAKRAETAV